MKILKRFKNKKKKWSILNNKELKIRIKVEEKISMIVVNKR